MVIPVGGCNDQMMTVCKADRSPAVALKVLVVVLADSAPKLDSPIGKQAAAVDRLIDTLSCL